MNRAVFLDRDGTLIEEKNYICNLSQSFIFPFAFEAVRLMKDMDYKIIVITNQSAIARGICTKEQVENLHKELNSAFHKENAVIDGFYYCPYHPEGSVKEYRKTSTLRKPEPGMLLQAAKDHNLNLTESFMVGDNIIDIQAGQKAGCKTTLVLTGKGKNHVNLLNQNNIQPTTIAKNILHFATIQLPPL